jgi:D-sedoheptulose 7-phosphate isomerase
MSYRIDELFERYPELESVKGAILSGFNIIKQAFADNGTLYACGNGGSAADAEHMVGELMKGFLLPRKVSPELYSSLKSEYGDDGVALADNLQEGLRAISLNGHPSLATAFGNDVDFEMIFAQQLYVLGRRGDVLIGFSTSGNSVNILKAFKIARVLGIKTIAMTGEGGGACRAVVDCCINVPEVETYKVQELHLPVYHALCAMLEDEFYGR